MRAALMRRFMCTFDIRFRYALQKEIVITFCNGYTENVSQRRIRLFQLFYILLTSRLLH